MPVSHRVWRYELDWLSWVALIRHDHHFLGIVRNLWLRLLAPLLADAHQHSELVLEVVIVENLVSVVHALLLVLTDGGFLLGTSLYLLIDR